MLPEARKVLEKSLHLESDLYMFIKQRLAKQTREYGFEKVWLPVVKFSNNKAKLNDKDECYLLPFFG